MRMRKGEFDVASGPNQHHIPQFLQRAFAPNTKRKPKEIWIYAASEAPELKLISKTAADDYFYGSGSLDESFKPAENRLAPACAKIRKQPVGSTVDAIVAADIVTHLAPRSSHLRASIAAAVQQLTDVVCSIFSDPNRVQQLLGLENDKPTELFLEKVRSGGILSRPAIALAALPQAVLERAAFYIAKESFNANASEHLSLLTRPFVEMADRSEPLAQDGHIRALERMRDGPNAREDRLREYEWRVEAAPSGGAILPDCIALAYGPEGPAFPLMFVGPDFDGVVMPLSTDRLLVGRQATRVTIDIAPFNEDAAASSQEFFLAHEDNEFLRSLLPLIGTRTNTFFGAALDAGAKSVFPPAHELDSPASDSPLPEGQKPSDEQQQISYQMSFLGFASEEIAHEIADVAKPVVTSVASYLSLSRLDGLTFAADYPAALREVDRGREDLTPIETVATDSVIGIARMVMVIREREVKGRIVLHASIAEHLLSDDEASTGWALHVLVHQLALVNMIELVETALPGTLLKPIDSPFQWFLYQELDRALHGYVAAFASAPFGNPEEISGAYRDFLISALETMKAEIVSARLSYRYHGDLDRLLPIAMPLVGQVLYFAAELLGNCVGADRRALDGDGRLLTALRHTNLEHWLQDFGRDLQQFHERRGSWRSFDEFLALNRHVERLLWSVGLFPWESPGGLRVEIPLLTDAQALLAGPTNNHC